MPAGIAVDATPSARLPPRYPHSPPSHREVGDLIGVNDGKSGHDRVGPRSPPDRLRRSSGAGPSSRAVGGVDLGSSEDDRVGAEPKTPTTRRAPPSYEDALLSARRIPPKSPPRPGAEHDGERGPKKNDQPRAPPPSHRASRAEPPMTLPSPPRAIRRGSGARRARVPGPREPVEEVSDGEPLPSPSTRAPPSKKNGHAADRRDPAVSTTVPSRRPTPYPPSRRYEEIRVTYPAARARQLTALEAYKVRARDTPTRVRYPISPRTAQHPQKPRAGVSPMHRSLTTARLTAPLNPPPTRDPSTRPRRPRRGSPAERPAPTSL